MSKIYTEEIKHVYEKINGKYYKVAYKIVNVLDGVKEIPDFMFNEREDILEINLPDSVESIGKGAFMKCYNLQNVKMPKNLKEIGDQAFYGVLGMQSIEIPKSTEVVGKDIIKKSSITKILASEEQMEKIVFHFKDVCKSVEIAPSELKNNIWVEYKISGAESRGIGRSARNKIITRNTCTKGKNKPVILKTERYNSVSNEWSVLKKNTKDEELSR